MIYEEDHIIGLEDCGRKGKMSLEGIISMLEDVGCRHSDSVGDGVIAGSLKGVAWVITEWNLKLLKRPVYGEKLHISTWTRIPTSTHTVSREYTVCDESGAQCILVISKLVLFDLRAGCVIPISAELIGKYEPEEKRAFKCGAVSVVEEPKKYDSETVVALRRSDIDFNSHMHNLSYLDIALEALPQDVYKRDDFSSLRIIYRKPIKSGETVVCKHHASEGIHTVGVYGGDGILRAYVVFTDA